MATDGEAKRHLLCCFPVHLSCVRACRRIVRGWMDGSTVPMKVGFGERKPSKCQHSRLILSFDITHKPTNVSIPRQVLHLLIRGILQSGKKKLDGWGATSEDASLPTPSCPVTLVSEVLRSIYIYIFNQMEADSFS